MDKMLKESGGPKVLIFNLNIYETVVKIFIVFN